MSETLRKPEEIIQKMHLEASSIDARISTLTETLTCHSRSASTNGEEQRSIIIEKSFRKTQQVNLELTALEEKQSNLCQKTEDVVSVATEILEQIQNYVTLYEDMVNGAMEEARNRQEIAMQQEAEGVAPAAEPYYEEHSVYVDASEVGIDVQESPSITRPSLQYVSDTESPQPHSSRHHQHVLGGTAMSPTLAAIGLSKYTLGLIDTNSSVSSPSNSSFRPHRPSFTSENEQSFGTEQSFANGFDKEVVRAGRRVSAFLDRLDNPVNSSDINDSSMIRPVNSDFQESSLHPVHSDFDVATEFQNMSLNIDHDGQDRGELFSDAAGFDEDGNQEYYREKEEEELEIEQDQEELVEEHLENPIPPEQGGEDALLEDTTPCTIAQLTQQEYDSLPLYLRTQLTLPQLNACITCLSQRVQVQDQITIDHFVQCLEESGLSDVVVKAKSVLVALVNQKRLVPCGQGVFCVRS